MNEYFCVSCGTFSFGPTVQEDHDDFLCFFCALNNQKLNTAALFD